MSKTLNQVLSGLGVKGAVSVGGAGRANYLIKTNKYGLLDPALLPFTADVAMTYYVDAINGQAPEDGGTGSVIYPFKTIKQALDANAAEDIGGSALTIMLARGSYAGFTLENKLQNEVTLASATPPDAIITSAIQVQFGDPSTAATINLYGITAGTITRPETGTFTVVLMNGTAVTSVTSTDLLANNVYIFPGSSTGSTGMTAVWMTNANQTNYSAATPGNWTGTPPTLVNAALDQLAAGVAGALPLAGGTLTGPLIFNNTTLKFIQGTGGGAHTLTISVPALAANKAVTFGDYAGEVTVQGNTFNGASQLVQMTAATKLPAVNGSLLTGITGTQISLAIPEKVAVVAADRFLLWDSAASANKYITAAHLQTTGATMPSATGPTITAGMAIYAGAAYDPGTGLPTLYFKNIAAGTSNITISNDAVNVYISMTGAGTGDMIAPSGGGVVGSIPAFAAGGYQTANSGFNWIWNSQALSTGTNYITVGNTHAVGVAPGARSMMCWLVFEFLYSDSTIPIYVDYKYYMLWSTGYNVVGADFGESFQTNAPPVALSILTPTVDGSNNVRIGVSLGAPLPGNVSAVNVYYHTDIAPVMTPP